MLHTIITGRIIIDAIKKQPKNVELQNLLLPGTVAQMEKFI